MSAYSPGPMQGLVQVITPTFRASVRDTPKVRGRKRARWRRLIRRGYYYGPSVERRDRIRRMTTNYHRRQKGWKT